MMLRCKFTFKSIIIMMVYILYLKHFQHLTLSLCLSLIHFISVIIVHFVCLSLAFDINLYACLHITHVTWFVYGNALEKHMVISVRCPMARMCVIVYNGTKNHNYGSKSCPITKVMHTRINKQLQYYTNR